MQVIAGHDPEDPGSANVAIPDYGAALTGDVKGLVIGVPENWLQEDAPEPATQAAFEAALDVFRGLGCSVRPVQLPPLRQYDDAKKIIAVAELFTIHGKDLRTRPELFGASLRYRIIAGGLVRAEDYINAMRMRTDLARAMQNVMATVDLIMLPTSEPAGRLEPYCHPRCSRGRPLPRHSMSVAIRRCPYAAVSRRTACRFRCRSPAGCSSDATVLRAGDAARKATPWRDKRPALAVTETA